MDQEKNIRSNFKIKFVHFPVHSSLHFLIHSNNKHYNLRGIERRAMGQNPNANVVIFSPKFAKLLL